ncbi:50S ribosomal protein L16 [Candidatus Micrarchaeota archaeon]|nr:50S ribosomal protein L16 [Candidatus Micrarchaeota archaeon]MBI5177239.1 50S ribosomal protein L16 [Candidatus Micrarchaeota archaeon]
MSRRKPRKSYVKGAPHVKVRQYNMGTDKRFDIEVELVADGNIQLRDNAIEAARQAANKYLEKKLLDNYFFQVVAFPHLVLREHSALGVAGADRISKGMKRAFGKPKGRMARVRAGEAIFRGRIASAQLPEMKEALRKAHTKLSGTYTVVSRDITADSVNLLRSLVGRKMKKKVEEVKVEEAAAAPTAEGAVAAAPAGKEGAAPAKAEEAKPAAGKKK